MMLTGEAHLVDCVQWIDPKGEHALNTDVRGVGKTPALVGCRVEEESARDDLKEKKVSSVDGTFGARSSPDDCGDTGAVAVKPWKPAPRCGSSTARRTAAPVTIVVGVGGFLSDDLADCREQLMVLCYHIDLN